MTNLFHKIKGWTFQEWVFIIFSTLWIGYLSLDYWNKHPLYAISITHYRYLNLSLFIIFSGLILGAYYKKQFLFKRVKKPFLNGVLIITLAMALVLIIILSFNKYWKAPIGPENYLHVLGLGLYVLAGGFIVCLASFSSGRLLRRIIHKEKKSFATLWLVDLALGFMIYMFSLFFAGIFGFLNMPVTLAILVFLIAINLKESIRFIKVILLNRINIPKDLNVWGIYFAWTTLVFITLNFIYSLAPFPLGFDARNYYVSISKLIYETEGIIAGFQPYAWSLVMSTGYIAFDSPSITLFLSSLGGILSIFAIYDLFVNHFGINKNYTVGAIFLFAATPAITNHWIVEYKIDLTLLFIQLVLINFILHWIFRKKGKNKILPLIDTKEDFRILIVVSLLIGFALTVKVLSIFIIIALFIAFWGLSKDLAGIFSLALGTVGLALLLGLDDLSGLRSYHETPVEVGFTALILSAVFMLISFVRNKKRCLDNLKVIIISGVLASLVFSPWMIKNYSENRSGSFYQIILGGVPQNTLTIEQISKNYKELIKEEAQ